MLVVELLWGLTICFGHMFCAIPCYCLEGSGGYFSNCVKINVLLFIIEPFYSLYVLLGRRISFGDVRQWRLSITTGKGFSKHNEVDNNLQNLTQMIVISDTGYQHDDWNLRMCMHERKIELCAVSPFDAQKVFFCADTEKV
jgi:hypothetical protein